MKIIVLANSMQLEENLLEVAVFQCEFTGLLEGLRRDLQAQSRAYAECLEVDDKWFHGANMRMSLRLLELLNPKMPRDTLDGPFVILQGLSPDTTDVSSP